METYNAANTTETVDTDLGHVVSICIVELEQELSVLDS
jgi:hypothetical protein